ncbi:MAG: NAD-dependent epimerase/dehydratase family protein [Nanoarchaeota archaeon]|nr:GDP-mannose 4,6-dehydratase [Nanoarchaeota archaeon]
MSKELVTGGFGFIGTNLVRRLVADGRDVVAVDNQFLGRVENLDGVNCEKIVCDICNFQKLKNIVETHDIKKIYHLAGFSSAPMFKDHSERIISNLTGFKNILELAATRKINVVYATTSSLYARCQKPYTEDMKIVPGTPYELSKYLMEITAQMYLQYFGVSAKGARFFSVYGPYESHKTQYANNATQFLWDLRAGRAPIIYGDGTQTRDFTYVSDVVEALMNIMEKGKDAEIYNVGTGIEYSFNQLVGILNKKLGTNIKPTYVKNPLKNYVQSTLSDISKIKREIGWAPKMPFEDGLEKSIEFYSKNPQKEL